MSGRRDVGRKQREEAEWTAELLQATREVACEACRSEVVRTGGVVSSCPDHRPSTPVALR